MAANRQRGLELVYLGIDQASVTLDTVWDEELAASPILQKMKASGWPWTRDIYPLIIERLVTAGAKVVALDLLFPTPREGDEVFRAALEKYAGQVVVGSNFSDAEHQSGGGGIDLLTPSPSLIPGTRRAIRVSVSSTSGAIRMGWCGALFSAARCWMCGASLHHATRCHCCRSPRGFWKSSGVQS